VIVGAFGAVLKPLRMMLRINTGGKSVIARVCMRTIVVWAMEMIGRTINSQILASASLSHGSSPG